MKIAIILFILSGIIISGCIGNPLSEVPVVKVNITFMEKQGNLDVANYTFDQGSLNYLQRPQRTQAPFPAIGARTTILKGKNSTIGPWEMTPFNGAGTYSFSVGFDEKHYPNINDTVHVSIYLTDVNKSSGKGETIGFVTRDLIWKGNSGRE